MPKRSPTSRTKICKQCVAEGITSIRPAPHPGPRCATHHREFRRATRERNHGARVARVYGITADEYAMMFLHQEGRCFICRRATGATRKLSVDHRHADNLVRGLLCRPCNDMLGHGRDDPDFFVRALQYLLRPPAIDALGRCAYAPEEPK